MLSEDTATAQKGGREAVGGDQGGRQTEREHRLSQTAAPEDREARQAEKEYRMQARAGATG